MSASDSLFMSASLCSTFQDVICSTFMPTSRSLCISTLSASSSAVQLKFMTPSEFKLGQRPFWGSVNFLLRSHVTLSIWKITQGVEKKKSTFSCNSFQLILWPVSEQEEPNKQRGIDGQSEGAETETHRWTYSIQGEWVGSEIWEGSTRTVESAGECVCEHPTGVYYVSWKCAYMPLCVNVCGAGVLARWTHAPLSTGSPWLALTRIADHINATTHLSLPPAPLFFFVPAICTLHTLCQTS